MDKEKGGPFNYNFTDDDVKWMKMALTAGSGAEISKYAKDKTNVGCVIRRSRSKGKPTLLAVGWNGFPSKTPKNILEQKAAEYDRKNKRHGLTKELALHAEIIALGNCSENPENATVYVTHVPCHDCAKQLVHFGVKRVFYLFWMKGSESSIEYFETHDISCIPFLGDIRNVVLPGSIGTFLGNQNICKENAKQDIPKEGSFHLSKKDSERALLQRSVSDNYSVTVLLEELRDKVDKILHELHENRN